MVNTDTTQNKYYLLNGIIRTERTKANISLMNPEIDRWDDLFDYSIIHAAEWIKEKGEKTTKFKKVKQQEQDMIYGIRVIFFYYLK